MKMRLLKSPLVAVALLVMAAAVLRLAFFGISVIHVPESSDESLSLLQAKMIVEDRHTPLLVMANPYQFPVESYLHAPLVKLLPRNAFGARVLPFILSLATTAVFIAALFLIAPLKTNWPALLLLLFPSAYVFMLNSAYFIPQHSSFALLCACALYFAFRMRQAVPPLSAFLAGLCAGLAFSNHMLAMPLLALLGAYAVLGPNFSLQRRVIPAFAAGVLLGLAPYILAVWLIPGSYGAVSGTIPLSEALRRLWGATLNGALAGVMGITPCFFPDNRNTLELIPGFAKFFAVLWVLIMLAATALRTERFFRRLAETGRMTFEANDVLTGLAWLALIAFLFSARSLSHTYRYLLPAAWVFPFTLSYLYARSPQTGRVITGALAVFLAGFNLIASLALMREWTKPSFAEKEAALFDLKPAIAFLKENGIQHAYASYWLAYRLTYETGGDILCSQPINERFPGWPMPYKQTVDASPDAVFITAPKTKFDPRLFEKDLAAMAVAFRKEQCGKITVYTGFQRQHPFSGIPVPRKNLRITASHNQAAAALLADDNPAAFWQITNTALQDLWVQIDLPRPERINRLAIKHTGFPRSFVGLRGISARTETGWADAVTGSLPQAANRFEYCNNHPVYSEDTLTLDFPPFKTGALRLSLHAPTERSKRAIGGIRLYREP
ncbi:MAG: hypothetical protein PHP98_08265 [Kiritimatiellae bacterium]|nr:hypothetical protein [Kiritimatiellia bacterium]